SIVQKGNVKIAISTNGKSPTTAKRLKEVLNEAIPGEIDLLVNNLHTVRNKLNGDFAFKVKKLNEVTKRLVEKEKDNRWKKLAPYCLLSFAFMFSGYFIFSYLPVKDIADGTVGFYITLDKNFH